MIATMAAASPHWLASFQGSVGAHTQGHGAAIAIALAALSLVVAVGVWTPWRWARAGAGHRDLARLLGPRAGPRRAVLERRRDRLQLGAAVRAACVRAVPAGAVGSRRARRGCTRPSRRRAAYPSGVADPCAATVTGVPTGSACSPCTRASSSCRPRRLRGRRQSCSGRRAAVPGGCAAARRGRSSGTAPRGRSSGPAAPAGRARRRRARARRAARGGPSRRPARAPFAGWPPRSASAPSGGQRGAVLEARVDQVDGAEEAREALVGGSLVQLGGLARAG